MEPVVSGSDSDIVQMTQEERQAFDLIVGKLRAIEGELVAALLQYEKHKRLSIQAHEELQQQLQAKGAEVLSAHGMSAEQPWKIDFATGTISKAEG